MNLKFKTKPTVITAFIILILLMIWIVIYNIQQNMRNELIQKTQIGANSVDVNRLKKLTGTLADLKSPDYLRLKQQFASIMKVDKDQRFIYLMGINKNNKIFFYVDDRPDGHPEGSPPGSTYDEASKEFVNVMQTGIPTTVGPYSDRWGSFASGCAPVIDPKTGKPIAVFAIDFATSSWYLEIVSRAAIPVGIIIILLMGLISMMVSILRGKLLKKSEEKYRFMFDNNPQPNYIYDTETLAFLEVNNATINHYDYSKEEFLSMTLKDIRPIEDIPALLENVKLISQSLNNAGEWRHIKKNGELIFVEIISHTVTFNDRDARHVLVHDITDRKQTETKLSESEINFRRSISESPVGIRIVSIDGDTVYTNKAFLDLYEYNSLEEFSNSPSIIRYTPESYVQHMERKEKRKNGIEVYDYEMSIISKNNEVRHVKVTRKEILWNGKQHFQLINRNITEQRKAEEELRKLSRAVEQSPNAECITDLKGIIEYVNPITIELTGYTPEELLGQKTNIFSSGEKPKEEYAQLWQTIKSGNVWKGELHNKKKNGELYWESTTISPIFDNQGKVTHFLAIKVDITERKRVEKDMVKLVKAIVTSGEAIFLTDCDGVFSFINPAFTSLYGFTADEIIGKSTPRVIKSGVLDMSVYEIFWQTLLKGDEFRGELINKRKDGTLIEIYSSSTPIKNEENKIIGFLGIQRDISEQKRSEIALNKSEEQLRKFASHLQNVREEEKIAIAREIHDDLGQLLVALKIDMGLLKNKVIKTIPLADSSEIQPKFDNLVALINNSIKTARSIMNGLRPELLELNGLVGASKEYLREFEERYHISCEFDCDISDKEMSQQQSLALFRILQEAMNNIVKHAKATLVRIQLQNSDNKVVLQISDNGVGFDKNNSGRNDSYGMIGMKERVVLLEGEIDITSVVGNGTTIKVEMPYITK